MSFVDGQIDILGEAQIQEEYGEVVSAVRVAKVRVDAGAYGAAIGDVFAAALTDLRMPKAGDMLSLALPNVILETRSARIVGLDRNRYCLVEVTLGYRLQRPNSPDPISGGSSLVQVRTSLDRSGNPITVTYNGNTKAGEIDAFEPQDYFTREITEVTDDPVALKAEWENKVNDDDWKGGEAHEWLCRQVDYRIVSAATSPKRWRFTYTFERRATKWHYVLAYKNENGDIPSDVTEGNGLTTVDDWHTEKDFSSKFP